MMRRWHGIARWTCWIWTRNGWRICWGSNWVVIRCSTLIRCWAICRIPVCIFGLDNHSVTRMGTITCLESQTFESRITFTKTKLTVRISVVIHVMRATTVWRRLSTIRGRSDIWPNETISQAPCLATKINRLWLRCSRILSGHLSIEIVNFKKEIFG